MTSSRVRSTGAPVEHWMTAGPAIALTVLYRAISYLSLLVGGMIVFVVSNKTR